MMNQDQWGAGESKPEPGWGEPPKGKAEGISAKYAVIAALVVVLILVAGAGIWFVASHKDSSSDAPVAAAQTSEAESEEETQTVMVTETSSKEAGPQPTQNRVEDSGACTLEQLYSTGGNAARTMDKILYCDGEWMRAGQDQTDNVRVFRVAGSGWMEVRADGKTETGFSCYDTSEMPAELAESVIACKKSSSAKDYASASGLAGPGCNGQNILIVESVIEQPGVDTSEALQAAMDRHPGANYSNPGQCPSLRREVNGQDIYPVYYNFGDDLSAMCEAKSRMGGNGRTLNTEGDFSDPC